MARLALQDGAVFAGRYEVVRCIQAGGMGAIYEVIHLQTKKRRALKVMLPEVVENEDLRKRFKLEATVTAEIDSEHIVETFDAGIDVDTGAPFLVMELLKGIDLKNHLRKRGHLTFDETLYLLNQVGMGLERTHGAMIVHRDLKPENLFLTRRDDGSVRVKILDFGIAKVVATATQTSKTKVMGTPLYMSPEQINGDGKIGPPADLYALAHIAFTLLVGRPYWEEDANEIEGIFGFLLKLMEGIDVPATERAESYGGVELPKTFDAWFEKSTAPQAADRFQNAREQIDALAEALDRAIPTPIDMSGDFTAAFGLDALEARSHSDTAPEERSPTQLDAALDTRAITDGDDTVRDDVRPSGLSPRSMGLAAVAAVVLGLGGAALFASGGEDKAGLHPASSAASAESEASPTPPASAEVDSTPTAEPHASASSAATSSAAAASTSAALVPTPTPTRRPPPAVAPRPPTSPPHSPAPQPPKPSPSPTVDPLKVR